MDDTISRKAAIEAVQNRRMMLSKEKVLLINDLEKLPSAEPHWIPVAERLPETGKSVLICDAYGDICIGHRTNCGYYFPDFCGDKIKDVRAWAELPEPYKGVTE